MIKILTGAFIFILGAIGLGSTTPIQMNTNLLEHLGTSQPTPEISGSSVAQEEPNPQANVEDISLVGSIQQPLEIPIGLPGPVTKSEDIGSNQNGSSDKQVNTPQQPENTSEPPTAISKSASSFEPIDEGNSSVLHSDTSEQQIYEIPIGLPKPINKPTPAGDSRNY